MEGNKTNDSPFSNDSKGRQREDRGWSRAGEEDRKEPQQHCGYIRVGEYKGQHSRGTTIKENKDRQDRNRMLRNRSPYGEDAEK